MREKIRDIIKEYTAEYPRHKKTKARWEEPLTAFASAVDPEFYRLKEVVSPTHALPSDLLVDARSIIAYFLPFTREINSSNIPGREASRLWAEAYIETNQLIRDLNLRLQDLLAGAGYGCALIPATHNFDKKRLISDWSHRHVAAIAGLGGFGLNNMLITNRGCCGRVGTLVTNLPLSPTGKAAGECCLAKHDGSCGICAKRCVNGALGADSFDRWKCYEMCRYNDSLYPDLGMADVCGKCLTGVPCSMKNPVKQRRKKKSDEELP